MAGSPHRLVGRIQRRLLSVEPHGRLGHLSSRDRCELEARIRRLHAMGDRFSQVRLSRYVASVGAAGVLDRVGGECVATEV